MEATFHLPYRDMGLYTIAIDPDDDDFENPGAVSEYVNYLGVSYPVGLETGDTYNLLEGVHDGGNPYPVDIIVDQQGIIRYIAREYDPPAMQAVIEDLLANPP